jgi:hypothetical protein
MRVALASAVVAAAAVAALAAIGWPARGYLNSDFMQYYAGSRALIEGASPYDLAWWTAFHERAGSLVAAGPPHGGDPATDWTTPYPLSTFIVFLPIALFPFGVAAPLFAVLQIAAVLAAAAVLSRTLLPDPRRGAPVALALVAASEPLWVLTVGGNLTGLVAAAFASALAALAARRAVLAGALLSLCLLKPHILALAAVALFVAAPADRRRPLVIGGLAGALVLIVPAFALRPGWVPDWLRAAGRLQDTSFSNASGWTIMRPFTPEFVLPSAVVVAACLVALAAWWWRRRPDLPSLVAGALPVSVLVAPHAWTYDYVVLVPTAVVGVAIAAASRARPVAAAALAAIVVLVPWALYIVAFARNGEDLSAWLLVAAEALVIILVRRG